MKRTFCAILSTLVAMAVGCGPSMLSINVHGEASVNPNIETDSIGNPQIHSHEMPVRIYQLKEPVDPCQLDRNLLKRELQNELQKDVGPVPSSIKKSVTNIDNLTDSYKALKIGANDISVLNPIPLLPQTVALLLIAKGEEWGDNSIRLYNIEKPLIPKIIPINFYVRRYDICLEKRCSETQVRQCP